MKYCTNCGTHKASWADHPSYEIYDTYRRHDRCWSCNKWTLSDCHGHCNHHLYLENSRLQSALSDAKSDASYARSQANSYSNQLSTVRGELTVTRDSLREKEGQLTAKNQQLDRLKDEFNNLKIESINKVNKLENEIKGKNKEIEDKNKNIEGLESELSKYHESDMKRELEFQEKEMETHILMLKEVKKKEVKRQEIRELRNAFIKISRARENINREEIDELDNKIEEIKEKWLERGVDIDDVSVIKRKCESYANLKIGLRQIQEQQWKRQQEQFEARQEQTVPPR